ncbi:unnamed protein product [Sphagnum balticum]
MATWVKAHDDDDVAAMSPLLGGVGSVPAAAVAGGLFQELARLFGSLVVRVALLVLFVLAILSNYAGPNDQLLLLRVMREKLTMTGDRDMNIDAACRVTLHPETCKETLRSSGLHGPCCSKVVDARELTLLSVSSAAQGVQKTMASVHALATTARRVQQQLQLPIVAVGALEVCDHTLSLSIHQLGAARADLQLLLLEAAAWKKVGTTSLLDNVKTRVTAAMEFHTTCIDTLMESGVLSMMPDDQSHETSAIFQVKDRTDQLLSNAIAFINAFSTHGNHLPSWSSPVLSDISRLFLHPTTSLFSYPSPDESRTEDLPSWVTSEQKKQLNLEGASWVTPVNVVVAQDGSGDFTSVQAAVDAAPQTGIATAERYVIYIKSGVYDEQVIVPTAATNFMLLGDGAGASVITGNRSVALTPGMTTFMSATLIIEGSGFIGKSFSVQNTAGAAGQQAVAMRVSADKVAFYKCTVDGWQDTLYTHTFRQFYRNSTILGTIDFVFGNGYVAFQFCTLVAKKSPVVGPQNTYTAQGKTDPGQTTGLSFQSCIFDGTADLKANTQLFKTYLGRPWKPYATVVNLKCNLQSIIDPAGWLPWNTSDYGLYTSFLAEYQDVGPGANATLRVNWSHQITNDTIAAQYQAVPFVAASSWVPATGIPLATTL